MSVQGQDHARGYVAGLEREMGMSFASIPVAFRDQWAASVRDEFAKLDVDVDADGVDGAVFAGAVVMAGYLFPYSAIPLPRAFTAVALLGWLVEHRDRGGSGCVGLEELFAVDVPPARRRRWWRRAG